MIEKAFAKMYQNFKLHFYQTVFVKIQSRELSLTTARDLMPEINEYMKQDK